MCGDVPTKISSTSSISRLSSFLQTIQPHQFHHSLLYNNIILLNLLINLPSTFPLSCCDFQYVDFKILQSCEFASSSGLHLHCISTNTMNQQLPRATTSVTRSANLLSRPFSSSFVRRNDSDSKVKGPVIGIDLGKFCSGGAPACKDRMLIFLLQQVPPTLLWP